MKGSEVIAALEVPGSRRKFRSPGRDPKAWWFIYRASDKPYIMVCHEAVDGDYMFVAEWSLLLRHDWEEVVC